MDPLIGHGPDPDLHLGVQVVPELQVRPSRKARLTYLTPDSTFPVVRAR